MSWIKQNWLSLVATLMSALYVYLQLLQWKKHGDDYIPLAVTIIVTCLLWAVLIIAIVKTFTATKVRRVPEEAMTRMIEKAGTLKSYAGQADWLAKRLEEVWHTFNEGKKVLTYPLGKRVIPDTISEWTDIQLLRFRVLYDSHIGALKKIDPDFHSSVIDEGFPCEGQDYLTVKRKIEAHADMLRQKAQTLLAEAKGLKG